ncbi:Uncharacterised protein [Candidatus Norongarragalina meridionalis]|nr:Uncharacterised protein [Candidatus Norongarragalina meridionalis]
MGKFAALVMLIAFALSVSAWCNTTGDQAGLVAGCCTDQWGTKCDSCSTDLNGHAVVLKYNCPNGASSECFAYKVACSVDKTCTDGACAPIYGATPTAAPTYSVPTAAPTYSSATTQPTQYPTYPTASSTPMPAQPISTDMFMLGGVLVIALLAVIWFVARKPAQAKKNRKG